MERPRAPSINRRSRSRHCFCESAGGGPGPDHLGTSDSTITTRAPDEPSPRGRWHAPLLNSVTSKGPLIRARDGGDRSGERLVFRVRQRDLQTICIEHLASHAGVTDIGFRVYHEQKGKRRFIIGAEEIPPPAG
jgi:hypothetical protein